MEPDQGTKKYENPKQFTKRRLAHLVLFDPVVDSLLEGGAAGAHNEVQLVLILGLEYCMFKKFCLLSWHTHYIKKWAKLLGQSHLSMTGLFPLLCKKKPKLFFSLHNF